MWVIRKIVDKAEDKLATLLISCILVLLLSILVPTAFPDEGNTYPKLLGLLTRLQAEALLLTLICTNVLVTLVALKIRNDLKLVPHTTKLGVFTDKAGFLYCGNCKSLLSGSNKFGKMTNAMYCIKCDHTYDFNGE